MMKDFGCMYACWSLDSDYSEQHPRMIHAQGFDAALEKFSRYAMCWGPGSYLVSIRNCDTREEASFMITASVDYTFKLNR